MSLLQLNNLKSYFDTRQGTVRAVDGVSLKLEKGETLGIVGESGSGKSVTCYSLLRLIPQPPGRIVSGTALFDSVDLLKIPKIQLHVGDYVDLENVEKCACSRCRRCPYSRERAL